MVNTIVQILSPYLTPFVSYIRFSKRLLFIFPIVTVQIDISVAATL